MNQKRQPKGTENGGQFAPDCNPESSVVLGDVVAPTRRDESLREKSDVELERFAEDANSNFDNWLDKKADEGEDWNEWSMADAAEFMEAFEGMIRVRKVALLEDVRRAVNAKIAKASEPS
jgi:hypothetical protein